MTSAQFENGYWCATELKEFAETIRVPYAGRLRKDELEKAIEVFLETGEIESPTKRSLSTSGPRDVERGLSLDLPVVTGLSNFIAFAVLFALRVGAEERMMAEQFGDEYAAYSSRTKRQIEACKAGSRLSADRCRRRSSGVLRDR